MTINNGTNPGLLFDYGGFPAETYQYKYPAPGDPKLAQEIGELLKAGGIPFDMESTRGWDHGVFVPMMLINPEANIPIVEISVLKNEDAEAHIKIGQALSTLKNDNVLILASGASFHNMRLMGNDKDKGCQANLDFDNWLTDVITSKSHPAAERI